MMKYKRTYFKISMLFILILALSGCKQDNNIGAFVKTPCPINLPEGFEESGKFTFGYMKVPELFEQPDGKTIDLAIAIFKCRADTAIHSPLILCAGGPGLSNIDDFVPALSGGLGNLFLDTRDVVIIESRGLKYSKPWLNIAGIEKLQISLLDKNISADETITMYLDTLKAANEKFTKEGINLSAFNTLETSNEIAYVMQQLGYDKFSIFGTSYGTEIVQYLLMNHPERLTSVVMNGTMDITRGGYDMHTNLIKVLESLFEKIKNDPIYSKVYPDLKKRFLEKLKNLNLNPDTINIKYWRDQKNYKVILNGNRVAVWLFHQMYTNTQIQLSIHKIINGDYSEIITSPGLIFPIPEFSTGLSLSMFLSETSDIKPENIPDGEYAELIKGTTLSLFGPYFWNKAKTVWPVKAKAETKQIITDIPILMLAGKMDYLCLPSYAKQFAEKQKNSYLYLFDDVAHSPVDKGDCAIMMLKEFFDNPDQAPDNSCMNEYQHEIALPK